MNPFLQFRFLILFSVVAVNLFLAVLVYKSRVKSATNKIFLWLSVAVSLWLAVNYISIHPAFLSSSLLWIRLSIFLAMPVSTLFFLLAHTIPHDVLQFSKSRLVWLFLMSAFAMGLSASPYAFTDLDINNGTPSPVPGIGIAPFAILSTIFSAMAVYILIRKFRSSVNSEKKQMQSMMLGVFLLLFLVIATIFIPVVFFKINTFIVFLPVYSLIFLGFTGYAIVQHKLFSVKIIATKVFVAVLLIVLSSRIFVASTTEERLVELFVFLAVLSFGFLLIRGVIKEVEQREKMEILSRELAEANEELKKLDAAKSEFISLASHQLRAPLTVIRGYVSMVLEGILGKLEEKTGQALRNVLTATEQLIKLVADLLDLSRMESGKIRYEFVQNDLISVVEEVAREFIEVAAKREVSFSFQNTAGESLSFAFDKDKIREVVVNFIDNSIKYSKKTVAAKLEVIGDRVRFGVKDDGIGMTGEDRKKLFIKFSRSEEARKTNAEGMGIGLYFVKRVIEDHKGIVGAESEGLGKGSTFWFEIPRR